MLKAFFVLPLCFWVYFGLGSFVYEWMVHLGCLIAVAILSPRGTQFFVTPDLPIHVFQ